MLLKVNASKVSEIEAFDGQDGTVEDNAYKIKKVNAVKS
jgi:hypothetical protein